LEAPHGNHYTPARGMRVMLATKLATLQMLLVCESGSEKMCLQSPTKHRQTVCRENIGGQFIPNVWYSHAECVAAVCTVQFESVAPGAEVVLLILWLSVCDIVYCD